MSVLPNVELGFAVEGQHCVIAPGADPRVVDLRATHPHLELFLSRFRSSHGRQVSPTVMLIDTDAPASRRTGEAMVGMRNALAVATVLRQTALELVHPQGHRVLYSDPFDFYPWNLDREFDRMLSITPATMALHRVEDFNGQPSPSSPVHTVSHIGVDRTLLSEVLAHWNAAYGRQSPPPLDRALFRSLNMANAAMKMPATTGATIFDYGRHCGLWISAFEILAHFDAGRGRADLQAVFSLLDRRRFHDPALNARRYIVTYRNRRLRVPLAHKLYERLYRVRNDFLHGNPVTRRSLQIAGSGRFVGQFAPLLYRAALRNFLDLRYFSPEEPSAILERIEARFAEHRYEQTQIEVEEAMRLARTPPAPE